MGHNNPPPQFHYIAAAGKLRRWLLRVSMSKNAIMIEQLQILCRHMKQLRGMTENLALSAVGGHDYLSPDSDSSIRFGTT